MTITLEDMRKDLLTLDDAVSRLEKFEPLDSLSLEDTKPTFGLDSSLNDALADTSGKLTDIAPVTFTNNGKEYRMTKEALLQATSAIGLPKAYVKRTPANLLESHLNYWYSTALAEEKNPLVHDGDTVVGFTKNTIEPFSNLDLLEQVTEGINARFGGETEVLVDYKFKNTLEATDVRLIIPTTGLQVADTGMIDIPNGKNDEWSMGIHLHNSLVGASQTSVDAYLFRWWCTNGATTEVATSFNRRRQGASEDVFEWARETVDDVLGGMESLMESIQALAQVNIEGNITEIVREIFDTFKIQPKYRTPILEELLSYDPITMYHVMNSITRIANVPENREVADRLMRIGGSLSQYTFDGEKAKIWYEGHTADDTVRNPYELVIN